jgi:hypothetical protein
MATFLAVRRLFRPGLFEYADMYVLTLDLIPSPNDGDSWPTLGGQGRLLRARDAFFERSSGMRNAILYQPPTPHAEEPRSGVSRTK